MRFGGRDFRDALALDAPVVHDWLNLPSGVIALSLWDSLHDAQVISIRSNVLERSMDLTCEIEHLRAFYNFSEDFRFILRLQGVQSARVLHYTIWPGDFSLPAGLSAEEQSALVAQYQAKWREESAPWKDFESRLTKEYEQVFDISDAALAPSEQGAFALKLSGHLNYTDYHEVYLRAENLEITGNNERRFAFEEFLQLGKAYWDAFNARTPSAE